jgi:hypothetical protein
MSEKQSINIDVRKLFNLGANMIAAGFLKQKPEQAKKLFKALKQGEALRGGQLTAEKSGTVIPVLLQLDRSEYRGQFNYPNFEACIKALLKKFETEVRKDKELKDLPTLTNEQTGAILFNVPSGVQINGDTNVLMMAVEPGQNQLLVRLLFMEPNQFIASEQ